MPFIPIALFSSKAAAVEAPSITRTKKPRTKRVDSISRVVKNSDFTVHTSHSNNFKQLTSLKFLEKYGDKVILCATNDEKEEYGDALEILKEKFGTQICYLAPMDKKSEQKSLQSASSKALLARFAVRKDTEHNQNEKNVIFISAEAFVKDGIKAVGKIFDRTNFDVASVKVIPTGAYKRVAEHLKDAIVVRASLLHYLLESKVDLGYKSSR